MSGTRVVSRVVTLAWKRRKMCGAGAAVGVAAILASVAVAKPLISLFAVFFDSQGTLQTKSSDPSTLNGKNPFFDASIGTNGQACVTCHEPLSIEETISIEKKNTTVVRVASTPFSGPTTRLTTRVLVPSVATRPTIV
jgi:hypothetical protein